jgi:GNAT superfamily N-acetyltransferase
MGDIPPSLHRTATVGDLPAVDATLLSAFFPDPLWGLWAFPDPTTRADRLQPLLHAWSSAALKHRSVHMTQNAEAVAAWVPPHKPEMTTAEEHAFEQLAVELFGSRAGELQALFALFDDHHPHEQPHYYLSLWGTHSDHRGQGLGTALIEDDLARIDAQRMPAYLESTNPANLPRYEALGFQPRDAFAPTGGPTITTMWRPAARRVSRRP